MIQIKASSRPVYSIAFAPDGATLAASCGDDHSVRLIDLAAGSGTNRRKYSFPNVYCPVGIAYAPDGRSLALAASQVCLWDLAADGIHPLDNAEPYLWNPRVAFAPDGRTLYVATSVTTLLMHASDVLRWDLAGPERPRLRAWRDGGPTTGGLALSADGRQLATGHIFEAFGGPRQYEYPVWARDAETGEHRAAFRGCTQPVTELAFSPDGRFLVGLAGPKMHVWDAATEEAVAVRKLGKLHFQALAFSPDGRYLATASNDQTARFWDTRTWEVATTFTWEVGRMLDVAFAPDGLRAAACGSSGKVVVWDVDV